MTAVTTQASLPFILFLISYFIVIFIVYRYTGQYPVTNSYFLIRIHGQVSKLVRGGLHPTPFPSLVFRSRHLRLYQYSIGTWQYVGTSFLYYTILPVSCTCACVNGREDSWHLCTWGEGEND